MTTDNLIIVEGGSSSDLKKALKQWVAQYHKELNKDFSLKIYKTDSGIHVIQVDQSLDNCRFNYLVNYIKYPIDIDYKVSVIGYTIVKDPKIYNQELQGKKIQVYIPKDDKEFDVVYVVSEYNHGYKVDFGGKTTRLDYTADYKSIEPDLNELSDPEIITVNKKEIRNREEEDSKQSIEKRFKIISLIAVTFAALISITIFLKPNLYIDLNFVLSLAIGSWLFGDYKMLQIDKYYFYSFLLALGFLCYGFLIRTFLLPHSANYVKLGFIYPISVLIIQKPLRLIFKLLFKREPVIDNPPPTFWDAIYVLILFIAFAILPLIFLK